MNLNNFEANLGQKQAKWRCFAVKCGSTFEKTDQSTLVQTPHNSRGQWLRADDMGLLWKNNLQSLLSLSGLLYRDRCNIICQQLILHLFKGSSCCSGPVKIQTLVWLRCTGRMLRRLCMNSVNWSGVVKKRGRSPSGVMKDTDKVL